MSCADDHMLDKTVAWITACLLVCAVVAISWWGYNYNYAQKTERIAIENGYCEVANVPATGYYHWEKCQTLPQK